MEYTQAIPNSLHAYKNSTTLNDEKGEVEEGYFMIGLSFSICLSWLVFVCRSALQVALNTWFWSTLFHTRDFDFTEKMDYFCATALVTYQLFALCARYCCPYATCYCTIVHTLNTAVHTLSATAHTLGTTVHMLGTTVHLLGATVHTLGTTARSYCLTELSLCH